MSKLNNLSKFKQQNINSKKEIIRDLQAKIAEKYTSYNYFEFKEFFDKKLVEIVQICESDEKLLELIEEAKNYLKCKDYLNFSELEQVNNHLKILYYYEFIKIFHSKRLPNEFYQKLSNEAVIPNLVEWFTENKNITKAEITSIAEEFWQILGKERGYIADIVNADHKKNYGVFISESICLGDPMVNSKYSKDWQGWIEYIEDKIEKELHKIDSKIVINSIINNELFENKLVSSVNINKQHLKDRLTEATHYGVLHHASDCTDINLKQEHSSSYYYAYHKNKQQKIIFDFLFCIHKEANKDSKIKTLENLFKVENTKDLYKWYCQSNHETFYHRGSSSVIGWLAKARAESLKIKFDLANDRHGSPLNLLFKGQLDQYALSCFDENEFINGLEALNINNSNSINNQLDKILALPNNDLHQPSVRENIAESLKTKLDLANDRHGSSLNSPFKGKLKHEFINGLEALNINNSNSINNQLDKFLAVPDDPYQLHEISLIGKTIPHTGSLKLKFHF